MKKIIDLSRRLVPGKESRRLEIRSYVYQADQTIMHDIDMMSHIGTHVEAPSHYKAGLPDVSQLALDRFIGEAICIDVSIEGKGNPISSEPLRAAKKNDILLLHSKYEGAEAPFISRDAVRFMAGLPIKLLGIGTTVQLEEPKEMFTHKLVLAKGIPIVEGLVNLGEVAGKRFVFFGFPLSIVGLDSSPIRAVAVMED